MTRPQDRPSGYRTLRRLRALAVAIPIIASLFLVALAGSAAAGPSVVTIANVTVSNLNDVKFTVSWTTSTETNGLLRWGTAPGALTHVVTDPILGTSTHYVTIQNLSPSTQIFFEVESGGVVGNNGGVPYSITTGPTLPLPPPGAFVYGYAYISVAPAIPLANAIVFLRIEDNNASGTPGVSQWLSARTDATGGWYYSLSGVRTETAAAYFSFTEGSDNLYYWGEGGIYGQTGVGPVENLVPLPGVPTQLPNLVIPPLAVTLANFSAVPEQDRVLVTWETVSEIDNQGFNLWRSTSPEAPDRQLNAALIPSQAPGSTTGSMYTWTDADDLVAGQTYYYWLEDVDFDNVATQHGPVIIVLGAPTAVTITSLDASAAAPTFPVAATLVVGLAALAGAAFSRRKR